MDPLETARLCLRLEAEVLRRLSEQLDENFLPFFERVRDCRGRVVCSGMGKTGLVMRKVAATFSSTGTPAFFLHPSDALHGDLGAVCSGDLLLLASASGQTRELLDLAKAAAALGIPVLSLVGKKPSPLQQLSTLSLLLPVEQEVCPHNLAPTSSTTALLAMGDALAMVLMEARSFGEADFARLHPAGSLGVSLRPVRERMAKGEARPLVGVDASMPEAIAEMSRKGLGIVGVLDPRGLLRGCLTDGDLRRLLERGEGLEGPVGEKLRGPPRQISGDTTLREARRLLHEWKITSLFVTDPEGRVEGLIHIHHLDF